MSMRITIEYDSEDIYIGLNGGQYRINYNELDSDSINTLAAVFGVLCPTADIEVQEIY